MRIHQQHDGILLQARGGMRRIVDGQVGEMTVGLWWVQWVDGGIKVRICLDMVVWVETFTKS